MKKKTVKKQMLAGAVAALAAMCCVTAYGAEEVQTESAEGTMDAVGSEEKADYIDTFWDSENIVGEWHSIWHDSGDYYFLSDFVFLPDLTLIETNLQEQENKASYEMDGDKITITPEEDLDFTITGELVPFESSDNAEFGVGESSSYLADPSKDYKLVITVSYMDNSDPLAPTEGKTTTVFAKRSRQTDALERIISGKSWEVNGKILNISEEGDDGTVEMDLDNGAQEGSVRFFANAPVSSGEMRLYYAGVRFKWENSSIDYFVKDVDETSITLAKTESPDELMTLTLSVTEDVGQ